MAETNLMTGTMKTDASTGTEAEVYAANMSLDKRKIMDLQDDDRVSLSGIPRVITLNDEEVHSISSSLLEGSDISELSSSGGFRNADSSGYSSSAEMARHGNDGHHQRMEMKMLSIDDPLKHRRVSSARRQSAIQTARKMSTLEKQRRLSTIGEENRLRASHRRISVVQGHLGSPIGSQTTLLSQTSPGVQRRVSAFGDITVMPIGDDTDDDMKIVVEEDFL